MVTTDELKNMKNEELESELKRAYIELYKLSIAVTSRQSKETAKLKALRKYIARIKTLKRMLSVEQAPEKTSSSITR